MPEMNNLKVENDVYEVADKIARDNISALEEYGAKNLFKATILSQTIQGLDITANDDGSIVCTSNGNPLSYDVDALIGYITLPTGTYLVTNAENSDASHGNADIFIYLNNVNGRDAWRAVSFDTKTARTITITTESQIQVRLYGERNKVIAPITFYPMIRDARITDPTYVPYAMTNRELTEDVAANTSAVSNLSETVAKNGAHNLLDSANPIEVIGFSNSNGTYTSTITDSRTVLDFTVLAYHDNISLQIVANQWISEAGTYKFNITIPSGTNRLRIKHNGSEADFELFVGCNFIGDAILSVLVSSADPTTIGGVVLSNIMLKLASDPSTEYTPYAMTNRELTERVEPLTSRTRNNITSRISYLLTAISEQNLEKYGYKIGDYFTGSSGYTYHLADMDTFYGGYSSYAVVSTHHAGVVVDTHETSAWMDGTVTTYGASTLHSYLSGTALDKIKADMIALFGGSTGLEHLIANYKLFGGVGTWGWSSGAEYISALTECQMYGCPIWSCDEYQQGEAIKKLTLFDKYCPNEIYGYMWVWLRSLQGSSVACGLDQGGLAYSSGVYGAGRASGLILLH